MTRLAAVLLACAACSYTPPRGGETPDAGSAPDGGGSGSGHGSGGGSGSGGLPAPIAAGDFSHALDKPYIRAPQTWIGDAAFEAKWTTMMLTPIDFLGGADSAFHADLASRAAALPGGEVLCHGDAKFDNFGWLAAGGGRFSDVDFDDAGACPAAADVLHFLLATDLGFSDPALTDAALTAYIDTLTAGAPATLIDPTTEPAWDTVRSKGVDKATSHKLFIIGGEVQVATSAEVAAVTALAQGDARFPTSILDIARDVHADGGSGGLRRFWILAEDATHPRTVIELKEIAEPGTELGPHSVTYDGPTRFDTLKSFWWGIAAPDDHFGVTLLGARFMARDKFGRVNPDPTKLTAAQVDNMIRAEASLLAHTHAGAWAGVDPVALRAWLATSAAALTARWRAAYTADGGA